jgi:hypothetical protein
MVIGSQEEDCKSYQATKNFMPAELVSPAVAFLSHESCPVTGECLDVMGGAVRRVYMGWTDGISDRQLTIETITERWDDVMSGASEQLVPHAMMDAFQLHNKPYTPTPEPA